MIKNSVKKLCITTLVALVILCTVVFAGCINSSGNYVLRGAITTMRSGEISATYSYFDGTRKYSAKFESGEEISFAFTTEEGSLTYKIADSSGNTLKSGEAGDSGFVFTVEEQGSYSFEFTASAHKGSYKLIW